MYLQELRGEVSQGDIFDNLSIVYVRQDGERVALNTRVMLITYDCEYDKPSTKLVLVADIFPLAEVPTERQGNVRKNKIFSTLYLPDSTTQAESFVDFRYAGLLEKAVIVTDARAERRAASLSDEAQLASQEQLSAFFGYGRGR